MDKELTIFLIFIGTPIVVVIINLVLIGITKRSFKIGTSSRKIFKSPLINLRDPWKDENKDFDKLSEMVKAIKDKDISEPKTKDL